MAYLHCHKCGWEQDDFWEPNGYTPLREDYIEWLKECLFKDKVYMDKWLLEELSKQYGKSFGHNEEGYYISGQDLVYCELMRTSFEIIKMKIRTSEEWEKVKDTWKCPECGSANWDID